MNSNSQFFLYNEKVEAYLKQAKHLLMLSMNGVVSENMSSLEYKLNYGVSLPRIVELSQRFPKDSLLANCFWNTKCRELKIMATLLYPYDQFEERNFFQWLPSCTTMELAEQLSRNLLVYLPWSDQLVKSISGISDSYHIVLIYLLATRQIQLNLFDFQNNSLLLERASAILSSDDRTAAIAVIRFLKFLSRSHSDAVLVFLENLKMKNANFFALANEEVQTEINFY